MGRMKRWSAILMAVILTFVCGPISAKAENDTISTPNNYEK